MCAWIAASQEVLSAYTTFGDYVCNKIVGINATHQEALSK